MIKEISALCAATLLASTPAWADGCERLPSPSQLQFHLRNVVNVAGTPNGGLGFPMWLTLVDGSGRVCAVVTSLVNGDVTANIWLGSRVISAQKANTANAFSTGALSLSTANLYSAVQPGGSLFGLQESKPVDATAAYAQPGRRQRHQRERLRPPDLPEQPDGRQRWRLDRGHDAVPPGAHHREAVVHAGCGSVLEAVRQLSTLTRLRCCARITRPSVFKPPNAMRA